MSFLKFTGKTNIENYYCVFKMNDKEEYKSESINIPNPLIKHNLQLVFANNPEITKSLLNSLLYPEDNNIIEVTYLSDELYEKINKNKIQMKFNNPELLRVDILCKCKLKIKNNNELENNILEKDKEEKNNGENDNMNLIDTEKKIKDCNNKKEDEEDKKENYLDNENSIIINLEFQIGFNTENTKKFIDYAKILNFKNTERIIVLSLVFNSSILSRKNKEFIKFFGEKNYSDYKNVITYDDYIIYQIDINHCRKLI